jgi:hypothetical protein
VTKLFGVSYNAYSDSLELLEYSINSVREHVDHINIVYQLRDNFGRPTSIPIEDILKGLKAKGLIDALELFHPNPEQPPATNEIAKRRIGVDISRKHGCQYHASFDCDELYDPSQLRIAKQKYLDEELVAGYTQMKTFYKTTQYVLDPPEAHYVSLFYNISDGNNYEYNAPAPVPVDPTRRMEIAGKVRLFRRDELEMLHLSYVRMHLRAKLESSTASLNFARDIDRIVDHYERFDFDRDPRALVGGRPSTYHSLKKVEDRLGIGF